MRRVPHRRPERGVSRAPGANIPQPGTSGEAPDGGEVEYRVGDGMVPPSRGAVNQDGDRVMEVLRSKHPEAQAPTVASLDSYPDQPPELAPVDITDDTVTAVAGRLLGGAGSGGTDLVSLQHWLMRFGTASGELRLIVGNFTEWLGNGWPPWAAYRALMSSRLIALDKQPGIRSVDLG